MNEINRLQQLAGLNEIKINQPINKKQFIKEFIEYDVDLLRVLNKYPDLNTFLSQERVDTVEEYLEQNGFENFNPDYITKYYNHFKPNEINVQILTSDTNYEDIKFKSSYKGYIVTSRDGDIYLVFNSL